MVRHYMLTLLALIAVTFGLGAQVTTDPTPLQETSENIVIYFHADQGNKGLAGLPATAGVYAHTGVITAASSGDGDWKYVHCTWGSENPKYKLTYVSPDLWKLDLGSIRDFYGISSDTERVVKLAFVFWADKGKKEGKAAGGKDIFVDVLDEGLQVSLASSLAGQVVTSSTGEVTFTASSTAPATITISVGDTEIGKADNTTSLAATHTFAEPGNYTVTATAASGSLTASSTLELCYARPSDALPYPGGTPRMGAVRGDDGKVTFCLAAPLKQTAMLVGSWTGYALSNDCVMHYHDYEGNRYFWLTVDGLESGKDYPYYYLVDNTYAVGDPYARLVLDPWNDRYINQNDIVYPDLPKYPSDKVKDVSLAVYRDDINDYDWQVTGFKGADKSDLIIYEMLLRDFTGTEGEALGNGTVRRAMSKINYLRHLGVNAVELLPINEFNGNISWGYNPNFYFAPDKCYGTPDDYKAFIDACHEAGIAVILDVVLNQADWQHPWYLMYEAGENPFFNATAPHAYSVLNDWNQDNELVQQQWRDMLAYWLTEYNVDGFRFDLVKGLGDNDSYANSGDAATNAYNASRVARMKSLHDAIRQIKPDAYFINENLAGAKEENEMAADGELNWANVNNAGCQFAMGYPSDADLNRMYAPSDSRTWGSTVSYLESHDEQRLAYKQNQWGVAGVKGDLTASMHRLGSAAAQMILAPGAHMIWQFSELGDDQNTKDATGGNNTDPKRVCWSYLDNPDRAGLMQNYAELITLRGRNRELFAEDAQFSMACGTSDWSRGRTLVSKKDGQELFTVINPNVAGSITVNVGFSKNSDEAYHIVSQSYGSEASFSAAAGTVTVPANCYAVVATADVTGVDEAIADAALPSGIRVSGGVLTVDNAPEGLTLCDLAGAVVYTTVRSADGLSLPLDGGIYLLRLHGDDTRTLKLMVY